MKRLCIYTDYLKCFFFIPITIYKIVNVSEFNIPLPVLKMWSYHFYFSFLSCYSRYSFCSFGQEINSPRSFFTSKGYPVPIFDAVCKKFLNKIYTPPTVPRATVPKMQFYFSVPCYNYRSKQLIQSPTNILSNLYPQIFLLDVNKNYSTIGKFFSYKEEIPASVRSSIISSLLVETVMPPTWASTLKKSLIQHLLPTS